jgi:TonB family protein
MRTLVLPFVLLGLTQTSTPSTTQEPKADPQVEAARLSTQVIRLYREGKFEEALPIATRVLELSESAFGPGDVAVANAASTLAELYVAKRKYQAAEPLFLRAIEINDKVLKPADQVLVTTLERYTCTLSNRLEDDKLKDLDKKRLPSLQSSTEPDRFWGALWRATELISIPRPDYPTAAKSARVSGRILVEVTVDEEGKVIRAQSMCGGSALLIKVSEEAARKAQFQPVVIAGKPIRIIGYLQYWFRNER